MTHLDWLNLLARIKAARGPDRALSNAVLVACGYDRWTWRNLMNPLPHPTASTESAYGLLLRGVSTIDLTIGFDTLDDNGWPACTLRWYPPGHRYPNYHACVVGAPTMALVVTLGACTMRARLAGVDVRD